ncbi:MAG: YjzC family protein [Chloroflexi bacterium]|nr:YjzC family protein [Chloroflexota bacterium]
MSYSDLQKPGETAKSSGKYIERGPRGGSVSKPRKVNMDRGETLPPTREKGNTWERR